MKYLLIILFLLSCSSSSKYKIDLTTQDGIRLSKGEFVVFPEEFQQYTRYVIYLWQDAMNKEGIKCDLMAKFKGVTIVYVERPFKSQAGNLVYGEAYVKDKMLKVGYHSQFETSALGHEIGHYALYACKQDYWEDSLRIWTKKYRLPY